MTADTWTLEGVERLTTSQLRVLMAAIGQYEDEGRCTVRGIMDRTSLTSTSTVHAHLRSLQRKGFVTWEPERHGTLRPTVRRVA